MDELPAGLRFSLTIGVFDGVHRGHERVLRSLRRICAETGSASVVLTFEPHPELVLRGVQPPLLTDPDERLARLAAAADLVVRQHFDRAFADQPAEAFVGRVARGRTLAALVMTPESAIGRDRAGTAATLAGLARAMGFRLETIPALELGGGRVSSSGIRALLETGRLGAAARLLGRRYAVIGEVVHGDHRGRELGYPTANLAFEAPVVLPPDGIYAVRVSWGGEDPLRPAHRALGVASLGVRPTFDGRSRVLEAHLFDFDGWLYGERLRVEFVLRQRGERRFPSVPALVAQMDRDARRARAILASLRDGGSAVLDSRAATEKEQDSEIARRTGCRSHGRRKTPSSGTTPRRTVTPAHPRSRSRS
ncbi:MAG TPA: riboflavin biosynthesis protein RibF [Candidatus Limnocylindrales bacterium]|nr:riboflavin biosynthesis protein RibF [Candidatus Limnocylindrales bacterium]